MSKLAEHLRIAMPPLPTPSEAQRGTLDYSVLSALILVGIALSLNDNRLIAVGLVAVALIAAVTAPRAAVAAVAIAIPFIHRPVSIGSGGWSLLELAIVSACFAVGTRVLWLSLSGRSLTNLSSLLRPYLLSAVALMLIVVGVGSLFTVADTRYRPESVRELRWVIFEPVAAFFLFRWTIFSGQGRRLLMVSLIGTGLAIAVVGIVQLVTQTGVVVADGAQRATGPYMHPNNLALYLDRIAVLTLALAIALRSRSRVLVIVAVICAAGLGATLSRGASLAYLAGALWIVWAARVRYGWRWIAAGAFLVLLLFAYVGGQRLTDRGSDGTVSSRELVWRSSIRMIEDHSITGVGLDQFYNQYGRRYVDPAGWPERYTSHPHNLVLDVWLRLGLAGLAVFVALVVVVIRLARSSTTAGVNRAVWIGAIGALLAGVTHGMVDNGFFLPDLAVLTWLMIALIESSVSVPGDARAVADG